MTIWKYHLAVNDQVQEIQMPDYADIIHVDEQGGQITLWAVVDENDHVLQTERFRVYLTGEPIDFAIDDLYPIGTVLMDGGNFVAHVFRVTAVMV